MRRKEEIQKRLGRPVTLEGLEAVSNSNNCRLSFSDAYGVGRVEDQLVPARRTSLYASLIRLISTRRWPILVDSTISQTPWCCAWLYPPDVP